MDYIGQYFITSHGINNILLNTIVYIIITCAMIIITHSKAESRDVFLKFILLLSTLWSAFIAGFLFIYHTDVSNGLYYHSLQTYEMITNFFILVFLVYFIKNNKLI